MSLTNKPINRPALVYHGGKFLLAPWIIQHFPKHRVYVEPFGGAGSVLLQKPRTYSEVYNDLDEEIVSFFRVLRDPVESKRLKQLLELTPYSRDEFYGAYEKTDDNVERARRVVIRSFMGVGSAGTTRKSRSGFCASSSHPLPAHEWMNYPDSIEPITQRLKGVMIENRDAKEVIVRHDSDETLFYVDPPYTHSSRKENNCYRHEMTNEDHKQLIECLSNVKGSVVLSGYMCQLYDDMLKDWTRIEKDAYACVNGKSPRTEYLWLNAKAQSGQKQMELVMNTEAKYPEILE